MEGYKVNILECSAELTPRERILIKDTSNAKRLDECVPFDGDKITITPAIFAVLDIHNEKAENPDYEVYVIIDADGTKYATGSPSFYEAFRSIWDEMHEAGEDFSIEVYKMESKNYKGKYFLTCSII